MSTEIVTRDSQSYELFDQRTPTALVEQARGIAKVLADVIRHAHLWVNISGKEYVKVEGWTTLGAMLGIVPREVSIRKLEDGSYEATIELVRMRDEAIVGRASAICSPDEKRWHHADEYAVRSMAATRATGKAYRLGFSWIMTLAGYEATPAEEVPHEPQPAKVIEPPKPKPSNVAFQTFASLIKNLIESDGTESTKEERVRLATAAAADIGLTWEQLPTLNADQLTVVYDAAVRLKHHADADALDVESMQKLQAAGPITDSEIPY